VQARQLLVEVTRSWRRGPPLRVASDRRVRIPAGGSAEVRILTQRPPDLEKTKFVLSDAPPGVSLRRVHGKGQSLILVLAAERGKAQVGYADNLIIDAYLEYVPGQQRAKGKGKAKAKKTKGKAKAQQKRLAYAGVLPAVPFVIGRR
jgi:hypothetical protein